MSPGFCVCLLIHWKFCVCQILSAGIQRFLSERLVYQKNWGLFLGFIFSYFGLKAQNLHVHQKNYLFLIQMFPYFRFVLKIFTTHLTTTCIKCLFQMKNHLDWDGIVKRVDSIERINLKSFVRRAQTIFLVPNSFFLYLKPMSEKTKPKPITSYSDKPIALIRIVGCQPLPKNCKKLSELLT